MVDPASVATPQTPVASQTWKATVTRTKSRPVEAAEENRNMESEVFMVKLPVTPGYSGFVPYLSCQGISDDDNMSHCLQTFREIMRGRKEQQRKLHAEVAAIPQLNPICSEKALLGVLYQYYKKYHPLALESKHVKKPLCEPPIPGWAGYLPRAKVTELGCSVRYTVMARNCYQDFMDMTERAKRAHQKPYEEIYGVTPTKESPGPVPKVLPHDDMFPADPNFSVPSSRVFPLGKGPQDSCRLGMDGFALRPSISCSHRMHLKPLSSPMSSEDSRHAASSVEATVREAEIWAPTPTSTPTGSREVPVSACHHLSAR